MISWGNLKEELFTNEGIHDPAIFKAVFLAGGPGSGKSYVSGKILAGKGLKTVNPDHQNQNWKRNCACNTRKSSGNGGGSLGRMHVNAYENQQK